jgi:hypothetical protein
MSTKEKAIESILIVNLFNRTDELCINKVQKHKKIWEHICNRGMVGLD